MWLSKVVIDGILDSTGDFRGEALGEYGPGPWLTKSNLGHDRPTGKLGIIVKILFHLLSIPWLACLTPLRRF